MEGEFSLKELSNNTNNEKYGERIKFNKLASFNKIVYIDNSELEYCYTIENCSQLKSEAINFMVEECENEYKLDVTLKNKEYVKIYGQVRYTQKDMLASDVIVTLYKLSILNFKEEYIPICETITDSIGVFQFVLPIDIENDNYKIKLSEIAI
ncbi:hypothetical protein [Clostridium ihumii]|uniref:hypothetical protein n=1 Tax=Clostridium ihumii TaxID=1470356 RepID=UPI000590CCD6|nr:hypothetical protein [Clostridium ihumii]